MLRKRVATAEQTPNSSCKVGHEMRSALSIPSLYRSQVHYKLGKGVFGYVVEPVVRPKKLGDRIL